MERRISHVCLAVIVAAALAIAGCTEKGTPQRVTQVVPPPQPPLAAPAAEAPPDLADCVLIELLPGQGQPTAFSRWGPGGNFSEAETTALSGLFGGDVAYERYEEIPYDNLDPGLISAIIAPGRAASLTYREPDWRWSPPRAGAGVPAEGSTRPLAERTIWGFCPRLTSGRFPAAPGETVIFRSEGRLDPGLRRGPDIGTPTTPRAVGARFQPAFARPERTEFTVVGLADPGGADEETIWLSGYPAEPAASPGEKPWEQRAAQRASAFLRDVAQYDRVIEAVAATGVRWRALRIRDGVVDGAWCHSGYDYAIPAVSAEFWEPNKPGAPLTLSLGARVSAGDYHYWPRAAADTAQLAPVAIHELRLTYDGKPIAPSWATEHHEPAGDSLKPNAQYRASVHVARQEGAHKVAVYRNDRLIRTLLLEFHEPK